ncbi:glutamine-trna ligase [Holotrichia oblita]|uniref:Glutamine-trna ligase n=1 Tax=Holotrichia oblita TaxID=644536 RepID=A0ACB9TRB4_HOLOL|nr:glutamine-trna ligase [Holotrichia oblita]
MGDAARFAESPAKAGMILSNPFCIIRTLGNARINYTEYFDGKELDGIFSPSHYPAAGSRTAVILGKRNIVIFLLESFSAEHSALLNPSLYPDGGGYTPFLDSLMLRGYYMTRAYANGRKSIEALPAILASMPSFKTPFALMPQGLGDGMQLPKILAAEGYETMFFCGSPDGSMGFDAYTKLSGVEKSYSKNDYDRRYPGNNAFDGYWGIWDEEFMDFMGEVLNDCRQPFFSVMFTLSSHHPYIVPERYADSLPQGITKIHKPVAYTDMSVRRFFEKYGGEEWFENSLFVFVADHVSPEKFSDESNTAMGSHRIVSFLYAPDSPLSGRCDDVFQQVDIMPTVLGLVGYDKPYFAFGRDIFGEPEREPVAFNYFGGFNIADDSIVLSFDEKNSTSVFALGDTLEKNNIMADDDPRQKNLSDMIKAVIQQYYLHIGKRSYVDWIMQSSIKCIGVLTSGGDAPGMNAAIRAVTRTAIYNGFEVKAVMRGYKGLISGEVVPFMTENVSNIIQLGGTILKTARSNEFETVEGRRTAYGVVQREKIDALVVIGGDGTIAGANIFAAEYDFPIVALPGTIDNDLYGTDVTIGYDTALNTVMDAVDKIRDTATSHERLFFIEVMGRNAGFLALDGAIATGAEAVIIPEIATEVDQLAEFIERGFRKSKNSSIVIVAESELTGGAIGLADRVKKEYPQYDVRVTILGHVQRGGSPTANDRILSSRLGEAAVNALAGGKRNVMLGIQGNEIVYNMRKLALLITAGMLLAFRAAADEGMWLLPLLEKVNIAEMQAKGLKLSAKDIYNANGKSLKDAIVIFGNGCTGEIVSSEGLLLTNHHCGYGSIQSLSSVDHDYLKNGFWAMNRGEELPAPGLSVRFIRGIEDVTDEILKGVTASMSENDRLPVIRRNTEALTARYESGNPGMAISVRDVFGGNQFFVFVIEEYKDVRLVGAPPASIGKFGGDTDNWMWPRHTGDFSVFRVYAGKDNKPAAYSKDNVPYKAPVHLKISLKGYKENDFAMIMGFPGTTNRFMTSYEIDQVLNVDNPTRIFIRGVRQDILKSAMEVSDEIRIQYASKYASSSNYWKNSIGMSRGLVKLNVKAKKQAFEDEFTRWAYASPERERYRNALPLIREAVEGRIPYSRVAQFYTETMLRSVEILTASSLERFLTDESLSPAERRERALSAGAGFYKDFNPDLDRQVAKAMFRIIADSLPQEILPSMLRKNPLTDRDIELMVGYIYDNSVFSDRSRFEDYVNAGDFSAIGEDPAVSLRRFVMAEVARNNDQLRNHNRKFQEGRRLFIAGTLEMQKDRKHYPDANSTMRLSYGSVLPYSPADAVEFNYYTTLTGVMEKEDPSNPMEFTVPDRLKKLYDTKDFGRYAENGNIRTCFISNNDITGGNSGSPVMNAHGELIGLAFDGNWEAMSGDIAFEPDLQRTISVDIRYVLFVMDRYAGAGYLLREMTIVENCTDSGAVPYFKYITNFLITLPKGNLYIMKEETTGGNERPLNFLEEIIEESIARGQTRVHTRFPPEPNGYLHIGHAKSICLNFGLAEKYGGLCNLRFDDTNPVKEDVEYVDSIKEDIRWLGFEWAGEYYASDYFEQLYQWAVKLIEKGKAYVDDQTQEQIRQTRGTITAPGTDSPWRNRSVAENLDLFARMRAGEFGDGEKVLRAKIDMSNPNMLLRDPIMYRILHAEHHRTGDKWCIYPMYDYAHGESDSIERITHSICTLEFAVHRPLYDWFISELGIFPSKQYEFARLNLTYTIMSKRKLLQLVENKVVDSWDDPRMPTISAMRRRGYTPESIRNFADRVGVAKRDNVIDLGLLEFFVREDLNKTVRRRMAVMDPLKIIITNYPEGQTEEISCVNNPEDESAGTRAVPFSREIYIERDDFMEEPPAKYYRLFPGGEVRLRYAYLIKCNEVIKDDAGNITELHCAYDPESGGGSSSDGRRVKGVIHWVSAPHAERAEVRLYDTLFTVENPDNAEEGKTFLDYLNPDSLKAKEALIEPSLLEAKAGERFQFERVGYFCVDKDSSGRNLVFNRTVTLKDSWAKMNK